jgi:hypothetical protein
MGAAAIGFGAAQSALGFIQAKKTNRAIRDAMNETAGAYSVQAIQMARQAARDRAKTIDQARTIEGRIRVASGSAGVGVDGSTLRLISAADADAQKDYETIGANYVAGIGAASSEARSRLIGLKSQGQSPALAAISGAITGIQTGLSFGSAIDSLSGPKAPKAPRVRGPQP